MTSLKNKFKKKFGKKISLSEINQIWDAFVHARRSEACRGGKVYLDRHSFIEVVGTPIMEDKSFYALLKKGKMRSRNGLVKTAELGRRRDIKYKITYGTSLTKAPLIFKPVRDFSKQVHEAIDNNNFYYTIQ